MIEGDDFSVDQTIGQFSRRSRNGRPEFGGPIEALPRLQRYGSVLDTHLDAIAVELNLVDPVAARGRPFDRRAKLRRHEGWHVSVGRALRPARFLGRGSLRPRRQRPRPLLRR